MHHRAHVGDVERGSALECNAHCCSDLYWSLGFEVSIKGDPVHEFHHQVRTAVLGHVEIKDLDDVRMMQLRDDLSLTHETSVGLFVFTKMSRQDLDRHLALQAQMFGHIDRAHCPLTQSTKDLVAAS